mmetsp:Transcript_19356/g.62089  ORF Transcript_19356/g.62089 Transcript_19356/m.62089 type:complete len:338 (+) Transcript_19356:826-1839(+)
MPHSTASSGIPSSCDSGGDGGQSPLAHARCALPSSPLAASFTASTVPGLTAPSNCPRKAVESVEVAPPPTPPSAPPSGRGANESWKVSALAPRASSRSPWRGDSAHGDAKSASESLSSCLAEKATASAAAAERALAVKFARQRSVAPRRETRSVIPSSNGLAAAKLPRSPATVAPPPALSPPPPPSPLPSPLHSTAAVRHRAVAGRSPHPISGFGWGPNRYMVVAMALMVDATLVLMLLCFFSFHAHMVLRNETTIEGPSPRFDVGWRRNAESVLGRDARLWLLPVWGGGPAGDGVHWPMLRERRSGSGASDDLEDGHHHDDGRLLSRGDESSSEEE